MRRESRDLSSKCGDCGSAMVWGGLVWMCPRCTERRLRRATFLLGKCREAMGRDVPESLAELAHHVDAFTQPPRPDNADAPRVLSGRLSALASKDGAVGLFWDDTRRAAKDLLVIASEDECVKHGPGGGGGSTDDPACTCQPAEDAPQPDAVPDVTLDDAAIERARQAFRERGWMFKRHVNDYAAIRAAFEAAMGGDDE